MFDYAELAKKVWQLVGILKAGKFSEAMRDHPDETCQLVCDVLCGIICLGLKIPNWDDHVDVSVVCSGNADVPPDLAESIYELGSVLGVPRIAQVEEDKRAIPWALLLQILITILTQIRDSKELKAAA